MGSIYKGLSQRAYAQHRKDHGLPGGSLRAVQKALEAGRITKNEHGKIDPGQADRDWAANTGISHQHSGTVANVVAGREKQRAGKKKAAKKKAARKAREAREAQQPEPPALPEPPTIDSPPPDRTGEDEPNGPDLDGIDPENPDSWEGADKEQSTYLYNLSRAKREHYQAAKAELEFQERSRLLIRSDEVHKRSFDASRIARDTLLSVPDRLSGTLAGESDPHKVYTMLREEITTVLDTLAKDLQGMTDAS